MANVTITAATWAAGAATFTTSAAHGITPGTQVSISGISPVGYNGNFVAAAGTTGSTIVVPMATNPGTYASGGSASSDPLMSYPALVTGRLGVARDGSIWATAPAGKVTMVAPAGTVSPQMIQALGGQPEEAEAGVHDDDSEEEHHRSRRKR